EIRGNIVKAFIVLKKDVDQNNPDLVKELQDHVKSGLHHINIRDKLILLMNCPKQLQEKSDVLSLEIRKSKNKNNNNGILHRLELERCKILFYQEFLRKHAVLMERRTASNPEWNAEPPQIPNGTPEFPDRVV